MSKIYTHSGDKGQTSLAGGKRVAKTHVRLEAYGTVDELSSHIGMLCAMLTDQHDRNFVCSIQQTLFNLSAILATEPESSWRPQPLATDAVREMEQEIDTIQDGLPQLRAFVLPGGCPTAAQAHICRTVCRRAERRIYALAEEFPVEDTVLQYINRLSDYFFVLARKVNKHTGVDEILKN